MRLAALMAFIFALAGISAGHAAEPVARVLNSQSTAEIFVERTTVRAGEPLWLGIRFTPIEGWHSYWENYGDTGKKPELNWTLPDGWTADEPLYPVPYRLPVGPFMNYGYEVPATLLVRLTPPDTLPDAPIGIVMDGDWLVCEEVCVPESGHFSFQMIPGKGSIAPDMAAFFTEARSALPVPSPWQARAEMNENYFALNIAMSPQERALVRDPYFFPLTEGVVNYAALQSADCSETGLCLITGRPSNSGMIDTVEGVLVVTNASGEREGFSLTASVSAVPGLAPAAEVSVLPAALADMTMWQAVLFAVLGGILLNLMPCVFPVLSLKAFSLIKAHEGSEAEARRDGLAYGAGILTSFLAVAVVLLGLRAAGAGIGWGFQLQSPVVIMLLALLLFGLSLNLIGLYSFGGRLAGVGQGLTEKKGLSGSFFTGVLATIVATPCTAPFMASALGFAVIQPAPVALAIFLSLGFGLALPYVLLTFMPALRHLLPRPGSWMETFRQFLAFPLLLTVIWLLWVLGRQTDIDMVALALLMLVLLGFLLWLPGRIRGSGKGARAVGAVAMVFGLAFMATGVVHLARWGEDGNRAAGELATADASAGDFEAMIGVEPWSPERLAAIQAQGRAVFVYYTADWCITCKVNERIALHDADVISTVKDHDVAILKADWTNRNDAIATDLARFGRNGVPLYLFYPAGGAVPEILPQILTPSRVLSAITGDIPES